ncbi:MAG: hypothetical protein EZS28_005063 [Streblomastix strix]|uniref:PPPDE domain-containing protein n=1 Tax=Streblomastix strix TaxID=222440 RepID=A0A5J4WX07_9EUKA|nr:MAG: hypothetical protein EZS28_005063 [Streblomastix strix]
MESNWGVYHSGVAIRGREYAYGGGPFGSGGVWMQPPEFQQVFCVYKESIDIGECKMKWKKIKTNTILGQPSSAYYVSLLQIQRNSTE